MRSAPRWLVALTLVCGLGCGADDDPDVRDAPRDVPNEDVSEDTPRDAPRDTLVDTTTDDGETVRDDGSADTGDLDPEWVEMEGGRRESSAQRHRETRS